MVLTVISHSICLASNLWKTYFTITGKICCTACGHKPTATAQELTDRRSWDQYLTFTRYCRWDPIHSHSVSVLGFFVCLPYWWCYLQTDKIGEQKLTVLCNSACNIILPYIFSFSLSCNFVLIQNQTESI